MSRRTVVQLRQQIVTAEEALEKYLRHKQAEGRRDATLAGYRQFIGQFFRTYPDAWNTSGDSTGLESACKDWLTAATSNSGYNLRLVYLRGFIDWAKARGYVTVNPFDEYSVKKPGTRVVEVPEPVLKRLLECADRSKYTGQRDYALFLLFLDTGIRPSEAFQLVPVDIDLVGMAIRVRAEVAKTGLARTLPISVQTGRALEEFLENRPAEWGRDVPIFTSAYGNPLSKDTWGDIMEGYSARIGYHVFPYSLRHTFAVQFLRRGGHVFALQQILGHTDVSMTQRYVHLAQVDIQTAHSKASPVAGLVPAGRRRKRISK